MEEAIDKATLRKASAEARAKAHGSVDPHPAHVALAAHIRAIPALEIISGYAPIRTEIDPMPVLSTLHLLGYRTCLPVVTGKGKPLEFRAWTPDTPMIEGAYGAQIPDTSEVLAPELLISPLLAFDRACYRLGYGGGFYDRTLEGLRARRRTYAVGFAYEAQFAKHLPTEPTDQPLDAVVTEAGTYFPS